MSKIASFQNAISLYAFIFVVWGFYRFLFKLPENIEELFLKPLVWLLPLAYILFYREKVGSPAVALAKAGWTTKNLFKSIYLAVGLGILFAVEGAIVNSIKYGGSFSFVQTVPNGALLFGALGLSLATAVTEETVFRGFIFTRVWQFLKNEWTANISTSIAWSLVHLPVTVFIFNYSPIQAFSFLALTFLFGVASSFVYARTGNVISSVLLHVFWEWPIILFR